MMPAQSDHTYSCSTLIIGAGIAGASLGFILQKTGDDVLMLELLDAKEKDKLCAGMITDHRPFDEIYGENAFENLSPFRISRNRLRYKGNEVSRDVSLSLLSIFGTSG